MNQQSAPSAERRTFLARFSAGSAAIASILLGGRAVAQAKSRATTKWEPARHDKDNWMDELPGKHRLVFDTISGEALGDAILFAGNFILANKNGYGLESSDLAIIVIIRHRSTAFGFNDAMWAKYGAQMGSLSGLETAPKTNPRNAGGTSLGSVAKQGVQYAVCGMATRRIAGSIAQATGGNADTINAELIANLVPNARMVAAGIVAVNRAQERGYSLVTA